MATTITEGRRPAGYLISEANGFRSREQITLTSGDYSAGTVLGIVTASGSYTQFNPAATNGSETAVAVLFDNVDASTEDKPAVITARDAEVNSNLLEWIDGITDAQKTAAAAALATAGIIIRS